MKWFWRGLSGAMDLLVAPSYGAPGYRARRRTWDDAELAVRLNGRHFVVTGANAGIGRATTSALASRGATVHMICRNRERGVAALAAIREETRDGELELHVADVADLASVRTLATSLTDALPRLDALVHNAGALVHTIQKTYDGLELTFATHVAGPFLMTDLLRPALRRSDAPRVIWVTSGGMYTQKLDVDALVQGREPFDGVIAYAQAKRAQVELAHLWAEVLAEDGISVASAHPGWADTTGVERSLPRFYRTTRWFLRSPEQGADTIVWLATTEAGAQARGGLYFDRLLRREHIPLRSTRADPAVSAALWNRLRAICAPVSVPPLAKTGR